MKKLAIPNNITRAFHMTGLKLKKHSPEILIATGVIGTVTSAVLACKATLKVNEVLDETKQHINDIHEVTADVEAGLRPADEYTPEDKKRDLTIVYIQTGVKLVKLYAPAVILGAISITSIVTSHRILRTRNVALAAAATTIEHGFKEYRGRVIERFGKELDRELRFNIKAKEIEETVINEDGTESTVTKTVEVGEAPKYSDFARCFDETCAGWEKDAETNLYTVRCVQNYANDKLKTQGYLFLNDVYDMLGIPRTRAGQVYGWIYDEENPLGDNYVDLGIYDLAKEGNRDFVNGRERSVWIDPNVDGNILKYI